MVEKLKTQEQHQSSAELEKTNDSNQERIAEKLQENAEKSKSDMGGNEKEALHEALEQATSKETDDQPQEEKAPEDEPVRAITKENLDIKFNQTLKQIRKDMTPADRVFSKVIHNPVVDKTSEVIGRTIARPNLILAGGIGTLTLGLAIYLLAKQYGYVLSGFESIGSFIVGWAIGIIVEFIRVGFKNKRSI